MKCLNAGDVIINRVNSVEYVGKCALVPELNEDIVFESNTMRFQVDTSMVFPEYVVAFLCSRSCRLQIEEIGARRRAVNMVSINQQDLKGCFHGTPGASG
jgi:type I restriction enzyme S subunit